MPCLYFLLLTIPVNNPFYVSRSYLLQLLCVSISHEILAWDKPDKPHANFCEEKNRVSIYVCVYCDVYVCHDKMYTCSRHTCLQHRLASTCAFNFFLSRMYCTTFLCTRSARQCHTVIIMLANGNDLHHPCTGFAILNS